MPSYTADVTVTSVSELITEMNSATSSTVIDASHSDNNGLVPAGTTIDGSGCLVYTNNRKNALLRCEESDVEIRNATFVGAKGDSFDPLGDYSTPIWIYNDDVLVENVRCMNWQNAGIAVGHTSDDKMYTPEIRGSEFVDNRSNGYGYGVVIYSGFPEIHDCYFSGNKHQIACSGEENAGYEAYDNYISDYYHTFGFEMHEPGGRRFLIHHNTFEFAHDRDGNIRHNAIMRGESDYLSEIHHNWFHNPNEPSGTDETGSVGDGSAIRQDTDSDTFVNLDVYDNHFGDTEPSDSTIGQRTGSDTMLRWGSRFDWDNAQVHDSVITSDIGVRRADDLAIGWDDTQGIVSDAVAYWTMDETSGDLIDVKNGWDVSLTGASRGATGPSGTNAIAFDGTDDYGEATTTGDPTSGGSFSIMAWVDKKTSSTIDTIMRSGTTKAGAYFFDYRDDERMGFGFYDSNADSQYSTTFLNGEPLAGTDHLVVGTFDESAGELTVYHDDQVSDTYSVSATRPEATETVQVGRSVVDNNPRYMTGNIGTLAVWDRALSSSEASALMESHYGGSLTTAATSADGTATSVAINCTIPSAIAGGTTATVHNSAGESETITLTQGWNDYSLSNFTDVSGDYWIEFSPETTNDTLSPEIYHSELSLEGAGIDPIGTFPMEVNGVSYDAPVYDRTELDAEGYPTTPAVTASNGQVGAFMLVDPANSSGRCAVNGTVYGIRLTDS